MGMFSDLAAEWDEIQNPFYPVAPDILFQASVAAGAKLRWTVEQSDGASRTITFVARKTHLLSDSSRGLFTVFIIPETRSGVAGARLRAAGKAGHPEDIGNGVTTEFGAAVNGALIQMGFLKDGEFLNPNAPKPRKKAAPTKAINPFTGESAETPETSERQELDLASQLKELTELHKSGALTEDEFKIAKKKLLS
jgi:hypothetical protein